MAGAGRGSAFQNVYFFCPPPCQKQYPASFSVDRERDGERGGGQVGGSDRVFSYIFIYFAAISTSYLIWVTWKRCKHVSRAAGHTEGRFGLSGSSEGGWESLKGSNNTE